MGQEAMVLQHPWTGLPCTWRGIRGPPGHFVRLQFWFCQLGEGLVDSEETVVLQHRPQGLHWLWRGVHARSIEHGLWSWCAAWHPGCTSCCNYRDNPTQRAGTVSTCAIALEIRIRLQSVERRPWHWRARHLPVFKWPR